MSGRRSGRPARKFSEEVVAAIPRWVEDGATPQDIAEALDTSVGSLRVVCSMKGVSLRRPDGLVAPDLEAQLRCLVSDRVYQSLGREAARRGVRRPALVLELLAAVVDDNLFAAVLGDYDDQDMPGVAGGTRRHA